MEKAFFEKYKTSEVTNTRRVICTPPAFTREHFFYIQEAGYLKSLKPHLSKRSGLNSYLFMTVLSGSGTVTYQDTEASGGKNTAAVSAKAGDCFFLDCAKEYTHISSEDDPWELLWIHFYGPEASAYYQYFLERQSWHFHSNRQNEFITAIQTILLLHENRTEDTDILAADQIHHILTLLSTEPTEKELLSSPLSEKLRSVAAYLDEHYTEEISLDFLSENFFISKYYLSREFKKEFGTTIIQYILAKKITYAKELLRYSNSSIEDISTLCGIDDASYFNKVFRKLEGCTASEYRKKW